MPSRTWRALVKAKRKRAEFRIILTVRGKEIVKKYRDESLFRKWCATYQQSIDSGNGVEDMRIEVNYPS